MSDQPLPCPVCGVEVKSDNSYDAPAIYHKPESFCLLAGKTFDLKTWNTRPTETTLRAKIAELEASNHSMGMQMAGSRTHSMRRVSEMEAERDTLKAEVERYRALEADLCSEIVKLKARVGELEAELVRVDRYRERVAAKYRVSRNMVAECKAIVPAIRAERDRLKKALEIAMAAFDECNAIQFLDGEAAGLMAAIVDNALNTPEMQAQRARQAIGKEATE